MMERIGKYLSVECEPANGRKTAVWRVVSNHGITLGRIAWYGGWRQYVFEPVPQSIYNDSCLTDLRAFLQRANQMRRERSDQP